MLLAHGANAREPAQIPGKDGSLHGSPALQQAAAQGFVPLMELLLDAGGAEVLASFSVAALKFVT